MSRFFIGLMSGTSLDGVDIAIVDFQAEPAKLIYSLYYTYPADLLEAIKIICRDSSTSFDQLGQLDAQLGEFYARAIQQALSESALNAQDIIAIGSHGQTIQHSPNGAIPYTLQIGDPNRIAENTGVSVVADFRRRDIAAGGQGAPLVPAFHQASFQSSSQTRAIINIGGIANISYLSKHSAEPLIGFDCGPGNTLMNQWCQRHFSREYDKSGQLASEAQLNSKLLNSLLSDSYFAKAHPKSTGPEYFNLNWLTHHLEQHPCSQHDTLRTLCELTVRSIQCSLATLGKIDQVFLCGGGVHNDFLVKRLRSQLDIPVETTEALGIPADWLEAIAFAWLAKQTIEGKPGNSPTVTGANRSLILGAIYPA